MLSKRRVPAVGTPLWERAAIAKLRKIRLVLGQLAREIRRSKVGDSISEEIDERPPRWRPKSGH